MTTKFTQGPWTPHPHYVKDTPQAVSSEGNTWAYLTLPFGLGEKIVGKIEMSTTALGWPHVDNEEETRANLALICAAPSMYEIVQMVTESLGWGPNDPDENRWSTLFERARAVVKAVAPKEV